MPDCRFGNLGHVCWRCSSQQSSAEGQQRTASSIGQKAEVSDTGEPSMFEEPVQEDLVRQGHHSLLVVMSVVLQRKVTWVSVTSASRWLEIAARCV
jgi:hypothetical protein